MLRRLAGFLLLFSSAATPAAEVVLPGYVPLPEVKVNGASDLAYDQLELSLEGKKDVKTGRTWRYDTWLKEQGKDPADTWARVKAPLEAKGWTVVYERAPLHTLHYLKGGVEAWMAVDLNADEYSFGVVELGASPRGIILVEPKPTPETIDPVAGDIPYLTPWPGSKLSRRVHDDRPLMVQLPGAEKPEAVGTGTWSSLYAPPPGVSNLEFIEAYASALTRAGWTIVSRSQGLHQTDGLLVAHYVSHGRSLWASLHCTPKQHTFQVADVGDLWSALKKECHAPLYGVFFDFNKATLKPESDSALEQVAALLAAHATLKVAVEGHTDSVGDAAYNQTLSEARARSVVAWQVAHGAKAGRLEAKGYGKTQPVADNATDLGRARNRRVEIVDPSCKRQ